MSCTSCAIFVNCAHIYSQCVKEASSSQGSSYGMYGAMHTAQCGAVKAEAYVVQMPCQLVRATDASRLRVQRCGLTSKLVLTGNADDPKLLSIHSLLMSATEWCNIHSELTLAFVMLEQGCSTLLPSKKHLHCHYIAMCLQCSLCDASGRFEFPTSSWLDQGSLALQAAEA